MTAKWWRTEPQAGEILWCHFSMTPRPARKPRPCLVMQVDDRSAPHYLVRIAYGTSQKTNSLYSGEFAIRQATHPASYALAGLSYDTKFNLTELVWLPYNAEWFAVPPTAPHGQVPRLGVLHPSMVRAAHAAFVAAQSLVK